MKDLSIVLVVIVMIILAARYTYLIWKKKINPALSTWIIFALGTVLSLITYILAENHDMKSGILNTMDAITVTIILFVIVVRNRDKQKFKTFEKWYLLGVAVIIIYGLISGDAFGSNKFTQILIVIGYIPTAQKLITEKRNTESFTAWGLAGLGGVIGLYPAIIDGNSLAILYSVRAIVSVACFIALMTYYEFKIKTKII